jgi:hypothetical protein
MLSLARNRSDGPRSALSGPRDRSDAPRSALIGPRDRLAAPRSQLLVRFGALRGPRRRSLVPRRALAGARSRLSIPRGRLAVKRRTLFSPRGHLAAPFSLPLPPSSKRSLSSRAPKGRGTCFLSAIARGAKDLLFSALSRPYPQAFDTALAPSSPIIRPAGGSECWVLRLLAFGIAGFVSHVLVWRNW